MKSARLILAAALILTARSASTGSGDPPPDPKRYEDHVRPFLARHCLECHGAQKPKGDLRLDQLTPDFTDEATREQWLSVLKRVKAGEMPPKAKPRPPEKDVRLLADWVTAKAEAAEATRRAE